jgi:hypothetical protein
MRIEFPSLLPRGVQALCFSAVLVLVCGCAQTGSLSFGIPLSGLGGASADSLQTLAVVYDPVPRDGLYQAIPRTFGWPEERMIRDVDRLAAAHIGLVLARFTPDQLQTEQLRNRFFAFLRVAETRAPDLRCCILLEPELGKDADTAQIRAGVEDCVAWFVVSGAGKSQAHYQSSDGRPVMALAPSAHAVAVTHPAVCFWYGSADPSTIAEDPSALSRAVPWGTQANPVSVASDMAFVRVPAPPSLEGGLRRARAERLQALAERLRKALESDPRLMVLDGWNDYSSGTFLEPNSFDRSAVYDLIAVELASIRGFTQEARRASN